VSEITDITIDWSLVNRVVIPYDRVYALNETPNPSPNNVQASSCIPSCAIHTILRLYATTTGIIAHTFEVPVEGYGTHDETNEGEDGIDLIRRGTHCRSWV